jgi:hypothetical protein
MSRAKSNFAVEPAIKLTLISPAHNGAVPDLSVFVVMFHNDYYRVVPATPVNIGISL